MKQVHIVPLAMKVIGVLRSSKVFRAKSVPVPEHEGRRQAILDMTLLFGLRRLGFSRKEMAAHWLRFSCLNLAKRVSVHRRKRGNLQQDQDLHHSWCRTAFLRGLDGLPPGSGRPTSGTWTAFLRGLDGLPTGSGRPSYGVWTAYLRDLDGLPPGPGRLSSRVRAAFLQLQDRLPPWPGRPTRERIPVFSPHNPP
jgi:hypothetical protein